ncbi:MAG: alginate lyase family protein [Opitutales bacterium]|jgi:hypothetical protein
MKRALAAGVMVWIAVSSCPGADLPEEFIDLHLQKMERLVCALNPSSPRTGPIVSKWREGRQQEALAELATYAAGKCLEPGLLDSPHLPVELAVEAEAALVSRFRVLGKLTAVPSRPGGGPDWNYRGPQRDKENAWMLNRHQVFPVLAEAARSSGDPRYRDRLNFLWQDWIISNPYPDRMTFSAQWRPLEVARRVLNSWLHVLLSEDSPLEPSTRLLAMASLLDHADALREHASFWGGNHLITEKTALLALALAWPEFRDAAEWKAHAIEVVGNEILGQTYPDGSYKELSNHYQRVVLVNTTTFLRLLMASNDAYRQHPAFQRIERMWEFFAGSRRPDGTGPLNNASDLDRNADYLEEAARIFSRRNWDSGSGEPGSSTSPSRFYPWAGQVFLRNGYGPQDDWVYLDAGPYGSAHQHVDRLHLSISLGGRPILVDNGRYTYRPGIWRDYFKGALAHSVLLLDNQPARQGPRTVSKPLPVVFQETSSASFCAATASFEPGPLSLRGAVPWTRAVLYDPRGFVLVFDHLAAFSNHSVRALWQFHPGISSQEALAAVRPAIPDTLDPLSVAKGEDGPLPRGYHSPDYNHKVPSPQTASVFRIDKPTTLVHVVQRPGTSPCQLRIRSSDGTHRLEFEVSQDGKPVSAGVIQLHPEPRLVVYTPH